MAKDVMGRFCEYVYANVETLTVFGKFNIEVQSVDRCNLNNLYLKTPRGQGARSPHKRLCMAEEISNA